MEPVFLTSLWLPILLAAVFVFFASALAWMVLPHHRSDWSKLPDPNTVRGALRGVAPGEYTVPYAATSAERASPEWQEQVKEGPNAFLTIIPNGLPNMGKSLGQWFLFCMAVSVCVAYLTGRVLPAGTPYLQVFRVAGTVAFLAYSAAHVSGAIWMGHRWSRALKDVADGLVYGLLTAGTFGWLWP